MSIGRRENRWVLADDLFGEELLQACLGGSCRSGADEFGGGDEECQLARALILDLAEYELQQLPECLRLLHAFRAGDVVVAAPKREQQVRAGRSLQVPPFGALGFGFCLSRGGNLDDLFEDDLAALGGALGEAEAVVPVCPQPIGRVRTRGHIRLELFDAVLLGLGAGARLLALDQQTAVLLLVFRPRRPDNDVYARIGRPKTDAKLGLTVFAGVPVLTDDRFFDVLPDVLLGRVVHTLVGQKVDDLALGH